MSRIAVALVLACAACVGMGRDVEGRPVAPKSARTESEAPRATTFELVQGRACDCYDAVRVVAPHRPAEHLALVPPLSRADGAASHLAGADVDRDGHEDVVLWSRADGEEVRVWRFAPARRRHRATAQRWHLMWRARPPTAAWQLASYRPDGSTAQVVLVWQAAARLQVVVPPTPVRRLDGSTAHPLVDVDFDGRADLALLRAEGCAGNCYGHVWLARDGGFAYSRALSELPNPRVDRRLRTLHSFRSDGLGGEAFDASAYHWRGDVLEAVWSATQTDEPIGASTFRRVVRARVGGALAVVCSALVAPGRHSTRVLRLDSGRADACSDPSSEGDELF